MSSGMMLAMAAMNFAASASLLKQKDFPMALVFSCYGVATLGLLWKVTT